MIFFRGSPHFHIEHFNNITPGRGALPKELHEPTLDHQPEHPRQVEKYRQAKQVQWNPLVNFFHADF